MGNPITGKFIDVLQKLFIEGFCHFDLSKMKAPHKTVLRELIYIKGVSFYLLPQPLIETDFILAFIHVAGRDEAAIVQGYVPIRASQVNQYL